ncbi:MAG TPA: RNB domain-containing ribonuclease [Burkholderiaceae bacterium]|jgi:exoribonuclease-2|nr:RNB domain-containing ribonuclease [Burkholderiaceae bacterium]
MQLLFEDEGDLKVGSVLSSTEASFQVELPGGRRVKIKSGHVLLRFERPAGAQLLEQARREADAVELDFLWQCAPQQEFGFEELAREYFGHEPAAVEAAAILLRLHSAPVYFHRKGKGRFRPAAPDVLRAALATVARRREQDEQRARFVADLLAGALPDPIRAQGAALLLRPDKNSLHYKAVEQAARELKTTALRLLLARGAIASPYAWHLESFLTRWFPQGTGFAPSPGLPPPHDASLALAPVAAFSIDDSSTTEIDDAFSVAPDTGGRIRVGIHIAAPAVAIARDDPLDALARSRMSTVYAPGLKITMLPAAWIEAFSLDQGRTVPALSLYLQVDPDRMSIESTVTALERVTIAANLRHDDLAAIATEAALTQGAPGLPFGAQLATLWRLASALQQRREAGRGRPAAGGRVDYSFELQGDGEQARVIIRPRLRDAPLDRIVSELMICANSHWGGWLAERGLAAVYRSQSAGRVKMSTAPAPHDGLGVAHYAWSTSPLRRYVDLANQRQLLSAVRSQDPAYGRNDADLFAVVSAFDAAYGGYEEFQQAIERYWCLRWLQQNEVRRCRATVLRGDLLRLDGLPLVARVPGVPPLPRGRCVELELLGHDLLDLSLDARLHRVLDDLNEQGLDEEEAALDPARFAQAAEAAEVTPDRPNGADPAGA